MRFSLRCMLRAVIAVLLFVLFTKLLKNLSVSKKSPETGFGGFPYMYDEDYMASQLRMLQNPSDLHVDPSALHYSGSLVRYQVRLPLNEVSIKIPLRLRRALYVKQDDKQRRRIVNTLNRLQYVYNLEALLWSTSSATSTTNIPVAKPSINLNVTSEYATSTSARTSTANALKTTVPPRTKFTEYRISFVIVVQVHDRTEYLRELLESLKAVVGIERTLLVISHDIYSQQLDDLVQTVSFCPLVQLFFPFSRSWYNNQYPADDPRDCVRDVPIAQAKLSGCNNAAWPDNYGHYRESKFTQTKQHYIWKLAFVFNQLRVLRDYTGPVIMLEDDHFVTDDLLYFATHANALRLADMRKREPGVSIVSLGHYDRVNFKESNLMIRTLFESTKNNMGMMVDREFWKSFNACIKAFCEFDDYNWDWSMQFLSVGGCIKSRLAVYAARVPRVHHIGNCGVHHRNRGIACNASLDASNMRKLLEPHIARLHSVTSLQLAGEHRPICYNRPVGKSNGGWGDRRDHELCKASCYGPTAYLAATANDNSSAVTVVRNLLLSTNPLTE